MCSPFPRARPCSAVHQAAPQPEKLNQPRARDVVGCWIGVISSVGIYHQSHPCGKDWQLARIRVCNWNKILRPPTTRQGQGMTHTRWIGAWRLAAPDPVHVRRCSSQTGPSCCPMEHRYPSMYFYWRPFRSRATPPRSCSLGGSYVFCGQPFMGWALGRRVYRRIGSISCWALRGQSIGASCFTHSSPGSVHLPLGTASPD